MLTVNLKKVNINLEESKGEVAQECAASIASCDDLVDVYKRQEVDYGVSACKGER